MFQFLAKQIHKLQEHIMTIDDQILALSAKVDALSGIEAKVDALTASVAALKPTDETAVLAALADIRAQFEPTPAPAPQPAPETAA